MLKNGTIQKLNFIMFGYQMVFGFKHSDFEPQLYPNVFPISQMIGHTGNFYMVKFKSEPVKLTILQYYIDYKILILDRLNCLLP